MRDPWSTVKRCPFCGCPMMKSFYGGIDGSGVSAVAMVLWRAFSFRGE